MAVSLDTAELVERLDRIEALLMKFAAISDEDTVPRDEIANRMYDEIALTRAALVASAPPAPPRT